MRSCKKNILHDNNCSRLIYSFIIRSSYQLFFLWQENIFFYFIKGNVKKQHTHMYSLFFKSNSEQIYIQYVDSSKQNIFFRYWDERRKIFFLDFFHLLQQIYIDQPNSLQELYIYLLCMGHSTLITSRNCICSISCQLDTQIVLKITHVTWDAHSHGQPQWSYPQYVVSLFSFNTVLYFLLHKGLKLYDYPCSTFHYSHCYLWCVSVIGNLWKRQEIRIASSQAVHTISFQDLNITGKAC